MQTPVQASEAASAALSEDEWRELLFEISNRQVIPIVGPGMASVPGPNDGETTLLYDVLAQRLAERLGVPQDATSWKPSADGHAPCTTLNRVVCEFLFRGNARKRVYAAVSSILDEMDAPVAPELSALCSISDFDLFLTTTIDSLLEQALERARPGFQRSAQVLAYDAKRPLDLPDDPGDTLVYHLVGSRQTHPYYAIWDEDYIEYVYRMTQHRPQLSRLFATLKERYLLFLGMPFQDWVVQFFLYLVNDGRFSDGRREDISSYLADREATLGQPLVMFFDKVVGTTRIVGGTPAEFVEELARRWAKAGGASEQDDGLLGLIPEVMPRGSVFISYSRDDKAAMLNFVRGLRRAGVPVWVDRQRLGVGVNVGHHIEGAVKNDCSFFVSLISKATEGDTSRYVHKERQWAAERHVDGFVYYLPIVIDDTTLPVCEPGRFKDVHFDRLLGGEVTSTFSRRLSRLVEEYRVSGQPRA